MFLHPAEGFLQDVVTLDFFVALPRCLRLAQPIRNIARMAKCAGKMPFQNVGVEVRMFAAAHGIYEVCKMAGGTLEALDLLFVFVAHDRFSVIRNEY